MRRLLLAIAILAVVIAVALQNIHQRWQTPLSISAQGYYLNIAPGARLRGVADQLRDDGVFDYPYLLAGYGRWTGLDEQIKRGEYFVPMGTNAAGLLRQLTEGSVIQYQVTLPEGITLQQALALLSRQEQLETVLKGAQDRRIEALAAPHASAEGLFFPDSYRYEKGATDWQILQRAHRRMQAVLVSEWREKSTPLPYETAYEALILASIVERETGVPSERGEIAGVFVRRLRKGMRLQTDPAVIYGLGEQFDGDLKRRHLQDETNLYNTYRHSGLPPTPISLPGREAIHAVLHPDSGNALYFVAQGDGSHKFSSTLQEHRDAVRKYQLKRSSDYRSSPGKQ